VTVTTGTTGTTRTASRDEGGFAVPVTVALTGLVLVVTLIGAAMGRVLVDQRRAAAAADVAALAAATALQLGTPACPAAERSAGRNGAELVGCAVTGEEVQVRVLVASPSLLGRVVRVAATAHAGPAESSTSSSLTAPALSSGWFPLPHFGDCTQEGQPASQRQEAIVSRVAVSHALAWWNPCSANPAPPGWPSYTKTVSCPVSGWRAVETPPMSHRSQVANSGSSPIEACSAA